MVDSYFDEEKKDRGYVKHGVLKRYFDAWLPIMLYSQEGSPVYVDGFAGAGKHDVNDEDGSPIVIFKAIKQHSTKVTEGEGKRKPEIQLVFIEKDENTRRKLLLNLEEASQNIPSNNEIKATFEVLLGDFNDVMDDVLEKYEGRPMLVFADPFGYSCKMKTCQKILSRHKLGAPTEMFINLMDGHLRWISRGSAKLDSLNDMVGSSDWIERFNAQSDIDDKLQVFYETYIWNLQVGYNQSEGLQKKIMPLKFAIRRVTNNTHAYHLVFVTTHIVGLKAMKRAMWKESQDTEQLIFSEWVADKHVVRDLIYEEDKKVENIVERIRTDLRGMHINGEELEYFILRYTPYEFNVKIKLRKALKEFIQEEPKFSRLKFKFPINVPSSSDGKKKKMGRPKNFMYDRTVDQIMRALKGENGVTGERVTEMASKYISCGLNERELFDRIKEYENPKRTRVSFHIRTFDFSAYSSIVTTPVKAEPHCSKAVTNGSTTPNYVKVDSMDTPQKTDSPISRHSDKKVKSTPSPSTPKRKKRKVEEKSSSEKKLKQPSIVELLTRSAEKNGLVGELDPGRENGNKKDCVQDLSAKLDSTSSQETGSTNQ